jgi:hypothetical protein
MFIEAQERTSNEECIVVCGFMLAAILIVVVTIMIVAEMK